MHGLWIQQVSLYVALKYKTIIFVWIPAKFQTFQGDGLALKQLLATSQAAMKLDPLSIKHSPPPF